MENNSKLIEFPAIDISVDNWNSEIIVEVFLYDGFFYSKSNKLFNELQLNHKIVDSIGNVYQIIGVEELKSWKKWLPFFSKRKMYFKRCNEKFSVEILRKFILSKVEPLNDNDYKIKWLKNIKNATNIKSLISGTK